MDDGVYMYILRPLVQQKHELHSRHDRFQFEEKDVPEVPMLMGAWQDLSLGKVQQKIFLQETDPQEQVATLLS